METPLTHLDRGGMGVFSIFLPTYQLCYDNYNKTANLADKHLNQ